MSSSAPHTLVRALLLPALLLAATPLVAQQTGEILGTVKPPKTTKYRLEPTLQSSI